MSNQTRFSRTRFTLSHHGSILGRLNIFFDKEKEPDS